MEKNRSIFSVLICLALAAVVFFWGVGQSYAKSDKELKYRATRPTTAEKKAAAKRAKDLGLVPGIGALAVQVPDPGGVPHYFGPYGNWAFSPLPKGAVATVTPTNPGSGYTNPVVTVDDAYLTPTSQASVNAIVTNKSIVGFTITNPGSGYVAPLVTIMDSNCGGAGQPACGNGANVSAIAAPITINVDLTLSGGEITGFTITNPGSGYVAPIVTITDNPVFCGGLGQLPCGLNAQASAIIGNGAIIGFNVVGGGSGYVAPVVTITDNPAFCGANGQPVCGTGATADAVIGGTLTGGIRKFVDRLPGLTSAGANNIIQSHGAGQYIPIAVPVTQQFSGQNADYYEIALVEYTEKLHSDLPPTKLRGYVQIYPPGTTPAPVGGVDLGVTYNGSPVYGYDNPHYLGPLIVAKGRVHGIEGTNASNPALGKPVPVRIKFYNLLPSGAGGDLFLPVDESVPGAGIGPSFPGSQDIRASEPGEKYTQNRATIHLHGNNTVWISDGNVHQWITPAGENTAYPKGVSVRNVPDMKNAAGNTDCDAPGSGCMTFFYTNAQSARLQFYHDHAMGITRLNVYAGEAAGYVITDAVEEDMINGTNVTGVNNLPATNSPLDPGQTNAKVLPGLGIPLIIQDKTFVDPTTIYGQDPTWNWGTALGDLWYPHVYMTVQNPWDLTGTNAFGRWHYGPWFNPPVPTCVNGLPVGCIEVGPVPNEYYQPVCDGLPDPVNLTCTAPWEPPMRPGNPNPSIPGESFLDTQMVNGTVYPYLEVEPKAYRFRVLNASNDRMLNLQLYVADPVVITSDGRANTEVKMVPVSVAPANQYADTPSGIPDPTTKGPNWVLIGTEGGFMPKPVVVPQQPVGYNLDPAYFAFGIVNQYSLFLGSAERADVVVDFSSYAGKTLILYNDSPAPVPAGAVPYDFYTGAPSLVDAGGAPTIQPGYGPNTRTIMQIRVTKPLTTPTPDVTLANLNAVFAKTASKRGVFEISQDPIIIPQAVYNSAYNATFPSTAAKQYFQIADINKTFQPINEQGILQPAVTLPLEMKAMHDEMGGVYDTLFGRMSGMLGLSLQNSPIHVLIPYGLASPPTDLVKGSLEATPIGVMPDGTQIWRIFHNGVDTHTIHTHLFHTQLINRVDQSGQLVGDPVPSIELGWKDTFRVNPLEVTYLAMRPTIPTQSQVPFEVPDSERLIDPTLPEGATLIPPPPAGWFDPDGIFIPEILNHYVNFGWEYVWHCHILSHEEMDMMHSLVFVVPPIAPTGLTAAWDGNTNNPRINLNWIDNSSKETGFTIQRATDANFTKGLTTFNVGASAGIGGPVAFTDTNPSRSTTYWYRVYALGPVVGDVQAYQGSLGFPTMTAESVSNTATTSTGTPSATIGAPTNLTATVQTGPRVSLTWRDNATNETYFSVERCTGAACTNFVQIATPGPRTNTGNVTYVDTTVIPGNIYLYQVAAVNQAGSSTYFPVPPAEVQAIVPAIPTAPTNFKVVIGIKQGNNYPATLTWTDNADNEANFTIQRATNGTFTAGLTTFTAPANITPAPSSSTLTQSVSRNRVYYYRIRANNSIGGSSVWVNALPFPVRTGP